MYLYCLYLYSKFVLEKNPKILRLTKKYNRATSHQKIDMNILEEILFLLVFIYMYINNFNYKNTIKIKNGKYYIKIPDFIDQKSNIS